jgi:hypothetical protein
MAEQTALLSTEQQATNLLAASGILDASAIVSGPTQAELEAAKDARITLLESQLAAQQLKGNNKLVQTSEGVRSIDDLVKESQAYREQQTASAIRHEQDSAARQEQLRYTNYRPDGSVNWAPERASTTPLHGTMSAVAAVVGLTAHNWTPQQKAKATTTTAAMVESAKVEDFFGRTSVESKATALHKDNPLLYSLLKERAKRERKF